MGNLQSFLGSLKGKNIHLIGATGAEGSSLLSLLLSSDIPNITAHDFINATALEKNFKIWHKGLSVEQRNNLFHHFLKNLNRVEFNDSSSYLKGIENADCVFVPQSWRLYRANNKLLNLKKRNIPFYSLMRLYLDFAPAKIVAVTGTVGKGSVAYLIYEILKRSNKNVYFTGNETWRLQLAEKLVSMNSNDYLVLEVSHRQLLDGFTRAPMYLVFTNLYPNHLDEMGIADYYSHKLSLLKTQKTGDTAVLNYDNLILRKIAPTLKSTVMFFSRKNRQKNIISVQKIFKRLMSIKSNHYPENILAAVTLTLNAGLDSENIIKLLPAIPALTARLEKVGRINNIDIYNDIKSTTPWATLAAIDKLPGRIILIMGGDCKGISQDKFVEKLLENNIICIALKSSMSLLLHKKYPKLKLIEKENLEQGIKYSLSIAKNNQSLLISPAAANFYTNFIKDKKSIRKIIASLSRK